MALHDMSKTFDFESKYKCSPTDRLTKTLKTLFSCKVYREHIAEMSEI